MRIHLRTVVAWGRYTLGFQTPDYALKVPHSEQHLVFTGVLVWFLAACGGSGGGANSPMPAPPVTPAQPVPTITLGPSAPKAFVDTPVTLTWSSTNATECKATDAWTGTQTTSGTASARQTEGGQYKFSLSCTGPGGSVTQSASLVVPIRIWPKSYDNPKKLKLIDPPLPYSTHQHLRSELS